MNDLLQTASGSPLWGLNVLIQVTAVAVVGLACARLFRRSAITRWWILGAALMLTFLSPVSAWVAHSLGAGLFSVPESLTASPLVPVGNDSSAGEIPAEPRELQSVKPEAGNLVTSEPSWLVAPTIDPATPGKLDAARASAEPADQRVSIVAALPHHLLQVALLVWCVGAAWKLLRLGHGWQTLRRIRLQAESVHGGRLAEVFDKACQEINPRVRPTLLLSSRVSGPVAAGIQSPVVILPPSLPDALTVSQLHDILLHEVAHVARRDQLVVVLQSVVASLFWPHPLVRMVNREFAQAREEVCDNFVLQSTTARDYSRTLLKLAQYVSGPALPASVGMLDDWRLESRVAGLLANNRDTETRLNRRGVISVSLVLAGLMATGCFLTISARADEPVVARDQPPAAIPSSERTKPSQDAAKMQGVAGKAAEARAFGEPLPASTRFRFAGTVVGPNRQPVSGAKVYIARMNAKALATTDAEGKFEFTRAKGQLPKNSAWGLMKIVAVKEGLGIASSPILRFESTGAGRRDLQARNPGRKFANLKRTAILKLVQDDVPIRGRIVDLEGEPVPNVTVQLRFVDNTYARFAFAAVTTNAEGRFKLHGIGRNRVVRLVAKSDRTEFSVFFARTANVPTKTQTTRRSDPFALNPVRKATSKVTYGAEFTHAVGPSVPLEGLVTDSQTGNPLAGVVLFGAQIGNYQVTPAREELSAVSDKNGRYRLTGLPLGRNTLFASLNENGYLKRRIAHNIVDDKPVVRGDFAMVKGIVVSGQVTDAATGEPIPGRVEYFAAKDNDHFPRGAVDADVRTGPDGQFQISVAPGEGYLAFRSRRPGYPVGVLDDAARAKTSTTNPFVQTKTGGLLPIQFHSIKTIKVSSEAPSPTHDLELTRQPRVTVTVVGVDDKPVNGATIEETLMIPRFGFARGSNRVQLANNAYQCREFTPQGTTDLIARHETRRLIGRISLNLSRRDSELPVITENAELARKIKVDRVSISGDCKVKLIMRPAATLRGRVVGKAGKPRVVRISGHGRPFNTDDDGRFELTMVLPNFPLRIQALHPGRMELLGTLLDEIVLKPGEVRELGDVQVKPSPQ